MRMIEDLCDRAFDAVSYGFWIATARHERLTQNLPVDEVERIFALGFVLEQVHQNFIDLARCVTEFAEPGTVSKSRSQAVDLKSSS